MLIIYTRYYSNISARIHTRVYSYFTRYDRKLMNKNSFTTFAALIVVAATAAAADGR